uniref:C-type lectin domain-containing protein n=1 Tax=Gasterosteus aculeatus aculeatus TaxID=481459 RepID=G3P049_GASAC
MLIQYVYAEQDIKMKVNKNTQLRQFKDSCVKLNVSSFTEKTCPEGWTMFRCSCYLLSTRDDSWENGRKDCGDQGADLVIIDSLEEQKFLSSIIKSQTWIGLSDRDIEGTWKWIDGTLLTASTHPYGPQPDNGGGDPRWGEEDCAHIEPEQNPQRNWNDLRCDAVMRWICEKLP